MAEDVAAKAPVMRTASTSSHPLIAVYTLACATKMAPPMTTARADPQLVVSGPEKTVVLCPAVSTTSTLVTNGALNVSKISSSVAYAGTAKLTTSHSGASPLDRGAHASTKSPQRGATSVSPVAFDAAPLEVELYSLEAYAELAHCTTKDEDGDPGGCGGERIRGPQSLQSPARHQLYAAPAPPSSHSASER